jgi:rhodanese-related sulfurtransferase
VTKVLGPEGMRSMSDPGDLVLDARSFDRWAGARMPGSVSADRRLHPGDVIGTLGLAVRTIRLIVQTDDDIGRSLTALRIAGFLRVTAVHVTPSLAGIGSMDGVALASLLDLGLRHERGEIARLLDTRTSREWPTGHIKGARHVPMRRRWALSARRAQRRPTWIYGSDPAKAATVASMLLRQGQDVVVIDEPVHTSASLWASWCVDSECVGGVCRSPVTGD